jgi:hypothetical protein
MHSWLHKWKDFSGCCQKVLSQTGLCYKVAQEDFNKQIKAIHLQADQENSSTSRSRQNISTNYLEKVFVPPDFCTLDK